MLKAAQWLLLTYLTLKFVQIFVLPRPGYQRTTVEPAIRQRLLRGEPILFIVAAAISVPPAVLSTRYFQSGYERGFERSVDCYGRLGALRHLGPLETPVDALRAFKSTPTARHLAVGAAKWIDISADDARRQLDERLNHYARRYSALRQQGDRQAIRAEAAAIEHCLSEPLINF